jgi:hypothetical protein
VNALRITEQPIGNGRLLAEEGVEVKIVAGRQLSSNAADHANFSDLH